MQASVASDPSGDRPSNDLSDHFHKMSLNGHNADGFSQGLVHLNKPFIGTFRDRLNGDLPTVKTDIRPHDSGIQSIADLQTPQASYEMNYTPLLPSQLLMGSPFQPGSPATFASPQFQAFSTFGPIDNNTQQHTYTHQLPTPLQTQHPMISQPHNMYTASALSPTQFYGGSPMQNLAFGGMTNGYCHPMQLVPGPAVSTSRTVYLGNIPQDTPVEEILGHVRSGQIESVRLLSDRNCAFISFLDGSSAVHFHSDAVLKKLSIRGHDIKVGWGKPSPVPATVALAVQQSGASRNVYLGNLSPEITEAEVREELSRFGLIDTIKLVRDKNIGFVHFLTIGSAINAVTQLPQEPNWQPPRRVFYGKDRCAYVSKTQQQNAAQYLGLPSGYGSILNLNDRDMITTALAQQSVAAAAVATVAGGSNNLGNRTVYLGNIHPDTTIEEICNVIRGGLLHHIRYISEKHICFVTFVDPTAAASFFALSNVQGLMIHNRRLKIGWGKHSQALPPAIALAVSGGASRNVYVGNIDESWTEDRLRRDFSEYGDIELVNALREKSCAFVNFTNIANAIKAIEQVRGREDYKRSKINFGKDRCGNPPRQVHPQAVQNQGEAFRTQQHEVRDGTDPLLPPQTSTAGHRANVPPSRPGTSDGQWSDMIKGQITNANLLGMHNNNPLHAYLSHMSSKQQQQQQPQPTQSQQPSRDAQTFMQTPPHGLTQQNGVIDHLEPSAQSGHAERRSGLGTRRQQSTGGFHGGSNSFSMRTGASAGMGDVADINGAAYSANVGTTIGGLLAPSRNGLHSRAISLPAFTPYPSYEGSQYLQRLGPHSSFGYGSTHVSLGMPGGADGIGGFGLAIHSDTTLPSWAEEEVAS